MKRLLKGMGTASAVIAALAFMWGLIGVVMYAIMHYPLQTGVTLILSFLIGMIVAAGSE